MCLFELTTTTTAEVPLAVSWRLLENLPDNRFQAELTLHNSSGATLAANWQIYFNSSSRLSPDSVLGDVALTHINGDFFCLHPAANFAPLPPHDKRVIRFHASPWAINRSDAPSGFYLIVNDKPAQARPPIPLKLTIEPFPAAEKLRGGPADVLPVMSAESRFHQNESLELLPALSLPKVIPTPIITKNRDGRFLLSPSTTIDVDAPLANEAEFLSTSLHRLLGTPLAVAQASKPPGNSIRLRLSEPHLAHATRRAAGEAYTLTIDPADGIEIVGNNAAGVFYGLQTLLALVPIEAHRQPARELVLDAVHIEDAPRFGYRGLHLDVARNFHSKETVKKLIDLMAFYKLNRLHWHLTDDEGWRVEIRALPELTDVGARRGHTLDDAEHLVPSFGSGPSPDSASSPGSGFYTQDDIVEILRYANERHIHVIPELDFPGHARAAVKAMQARRRRLTSAHDAAAADEYLLTEPGDESKYESPQMWRDNVVDVGREATYRFLDVVVGELKNIYHRAGLELTDLHLGGDEVPTGAWEASPACARIDMDTDASASRHDQLQMYFLARASEILIEHGIRPACWEDCLRAHLNAGKLPLKENNGQLDLFKNIRAYVWNNVCGAGREDAAYRLASAGYDVVLSSATHLYFDLAYEKHPDEIGGHWAGFVDARARFALDPLAVFKNAGRDGKLHAIGIQGQLWSENLRSPIALEYMAFPKVIALAERAWAQEPSWAGIENTDQRNQLFARDWNVFANQLGQRELPRLDDLFGGVGYRLPPPGAILRDGKLWASVEYPGLTIRYTTNGAEPTADAALYQAPIEAADGVKIKLKSFDTRSRGSRTVTVSESH